MTRARQAITRTATGRDARAVALVVPHGGADAGRDFESALELLQGDDEVHELWRRTRVKIPFAPAS